MCSTLNETSIRFLFGPITRIRVEGWIENLDYEKVLPILAIVKNALGENIAIANASLEFFERECFKHKAEFGITVHDTYQDKGVGTKLTQYMINLAQKKGLNKVFLNVLTINERAIHVYKKLGFKIEGRLENEYIRNGEYGDVYRMALFL
jgi:RimJ/RimL family protein N-acetyltransferase